ncbi:hypothetical protein KC19_5G113700 [Ceratodon purpureus]|uniref:Uncharacterized protein n=1 Tax=Ceratodon purpureus TaxID=3225 RepID=A0A8T0I234_CERPU|nr:hypothetical protein KC19_5G113700 [Ceratodon purpureus]
MDGTHHNWIDFRATPSSLPLSLLSPPPSNLHTIPQPPHSSTITQRIQNSKNLTPNTPQIHPNSNSNFTFPPKLRRQCFPPPPPPPPLPPPLLLSLLIYRSLIEHQKSHQHKRTSFLTNGASLLSLSLSPPLQDATFQLITM